MTEQSNHFEPVKLSAEDRLRLIDSIYDAGRTVTAGDVVKLTGMSAPAVANGLRDLAFESKAHVLVDGQGNVAYRFKHGFHRRKLFSLNGSLKFVWRVWARVYSLMLKTVFGALLFVSLWSYALPLFLTAVTMNFINFARKQNYSHDDWADISKWPTMLMGAVETQITHAGKKVPSNIFADCYSFVFGDGDPNPDLEDRKWHKIAQLIQRNNGSITCEQLAPYLSKKPTEDDMIPVMVRFNGQPEVTKSGQLVYVFPQLSIQAAGSNVTESAALLVGESIEQKQVDFLEERYWGLTGISQTSLIFVSILAALNMSIIFGGLYWAAHFKSIVAYVVLPFVWLWSHLSLMWIFHACVVAFHAIGFWGILFVLVAITILGPCMFFLSLFFFVYPLCRYCLLSLKNIGVWMRNSRRREAASTLLEAPEEIQSKLIEASQHSPIKIQIEDHDVIFDSSKDSLEQQFR